MIFSYSIRTPDIGLKTKTIKPAKPTPESPIERKKSSYILNANDRLLKGQNIRHTKQNLSHTSSSSGKQILQRPRQSTIQTLQHLLILNSHFSGLPKSILLFSFPPQPTFSLSSWPPSSKMKPFMTALG
jgi:hypothetical protein